MKAVSILLASMVLFLSGCSNAPREKAVTLVNAAAVDAPLLERVRAFAESQLHVPVRALEQPKLAGKGSFQILEKAAGRVKMKVDVTLIVLSGINDDETHFSVSKEKGIALINVHPLYTGETEKFARRIERQVMRAAAFSFGFEPAPDPFCVTRDYRSLEDLDTMGRNFSPPWQMRYAEEAAKRGLFAPEPPVPGRIGD